jgi:hypothetical protein
MLLDERGKKMKVSVRPMAIARWGRCYRVLSPSNVHSQT